MLNLQLLRLDTLIIHRIPKKSAPSEAPVAPPLSDAPTPDRADVRAFFRRRIRAAVEERGLPIEIDPARDRAASVAIEAMLADPSELTVRSRALAMRLFDVQDLRNPTGLLVAGTGTLGQRAAVALLMPSVIVTGMVAAVAFGCLAYGLTTAIKNEDAAQPMVQAIVLPLYFISIVFIPNVNLPMWLRDVAMVFPVQHLTDGLHHAFDPATRGAGFAWSDIGVLLLWAAVGLVVALRRFTWTPAAAAA